MKHMCRILFVSEAGYYRYKRNCGKPSRDAVLSAAMQSIRAESAYNDNYGVPRMRLALRQRGFRVVLRRVRRLMIELGWIHPPRRRPYGLTHATTEIQEKENLIKQDFSAKGPFTKLLTDISQVQCQDGKLYISPSKATVCEVEYSEEMLQFAARNGNLLITEVCKIVKKTASSINWMPKTVFSFMRAKFVC